MAKTHGCFITPMEEYKELEAISSMPRVCFITFMEELEVLAFWPFVLSSTYSGAHDGGPQYTTGQLQLKSKLISGVYKGVPQNTTGQPQLKMEHCAVSSGRNKMHLEVKCREKTPDHNVGTRTKPWVNISDVFANAVVEERHNYVTLSANEPLENYEFAVFGTPQKNDRKRMQMGVFGEKPVQGRNWKIRVVLFDDTMMAFEHVCEKEERSGRQLLTTLAGLFVSNSDEDIKINLSGMEIGWETKGSNIKTIKSKDAWNSPEDSANFPSCHFEISHMDKTKRAFFCGITATHGNDSAETELVEVYEEQENEVSTGGNKSMVFPEEVVMITVGDVIFHFLFDFQLRKEIEEIKHRLASYDNPAIKPPLDLALVYINQVMFVLLTGAQFCRMSDD